MLLTQMLVDAIRRQRLDKSGPRPDGDAGRVIRLADRAAKTTLPVLIEGEPGTGGDSVARAIQECGDRKGKPFVRVHADTLGEDNGPALFGSGDGRGPRSRVLEAQGGTLLIQAVDALSEPSQAALLRLIQDNEIEAAAGKRPLRADIRVLATTHANLMERVRQGRFREDLYYRLHAMPIGLLPLRARQEDLPRLAGAFADHFAREEGKTIDGMSPAARTLLLRYDWPGNVRQLESAVYRAVVLAEGRQLTPAEFPQIAARVSGFPVEIPPVPSPAAALAPVREPVRIEMRDPHLLALMDDAGELRRLEDLEAAIIRFALSHYRGHMSAISRRLGIGRSTLYRKLKDLGLEGEMSDAA